MEDASKDQHLLTLAELCEISGFSPSTIRRWVREGRIRGLQPGGRGGHIRFRRHVLEQLGNPPIQETPDLNDSEAKPRSVRPGPKPKFLA